MVEPAAEELLDPVAVLVQLGGVATRAQLLQHVSRWTLEKAVADARVDAVARGRYALPTVDEALRTAHRLRGTLCLASAALSLGWPVKVLPKKPQVAVPKHRRIAAELRDLAELRWVDLGEDEIADRITSPERTLLDCARSLPFDEALAVADSALRNGFAPRRLRALARDLRGPGARQARRIASLADGRAANPFESVLRSLTFEVDGMRMEPQVTVRVPGYTGRPDLVDERLMMILEADSFGWHGDRVALREDCRRYDFFVAGGWLVLRFAWEDVMFDPPFVLDVLRRATRERTEQLCPACRQAG